MLDWNLKLNFGTLGLCCLLSFVISAIWYGPLFGGLWLEYSHFNQKKIEDIQSERKYVKIFIAFLGTFITAAIYSIFIHNLPITEHWELVAFDAVISIGFLFTSMASGVLWGRTRIQCLLINLGYQFVNLLGQGIVIMTQDQGLLGGYGDDTTNILQG